MIDDAGQATTPAVSLSQQARVIEDAFALELGRLVIGWNDLQQAVCLLFCNLLTPRDIGGALAAWNAIESDRAQWKMLKSVVSRRADWIKDDVCWLVSQLEGAADLRNSAVHSPFAVCVDLQGLSMQADDALNHPRARQLRKMKVVDEFRRFSVWSGRLKRFTDDVLRLQHSVADVRPKRPMKNSDVDKLRDFLAKL